MVVRDGILGGFSATMALVLAANVGVPVLVNADALGVELLYALNPIIATA